MEQLIPVIANLQDVFGAVGHKSPLQLPQIVVVGSQSSGKSSVLEAIVGRDFLPRGTGVVTRRPLVLHLINTSVSAGKGGAASDAGTTLHHHASKAKAGSGSAQSAAGSADEGEELEAASTTSAATATATAAATHGHSSATWAEFLSIPGRKFYDFGDVKRIILQDTVRIAGKNKGIANDPIFLKVFSPEVVNLTLVDLPGITKVPIGDQPTNIEEIVRRMVLQYISNTSSIILAVAPATEDIANSEAIKMARSVDPKGERTIGVVTKLDLMDDGTDAVDVLSNRVVKLRHGFVGVVNRSQRDINVGTALASARAKESAYFASHPAYRAMAKRMGCTYLCLKLNKLLIQHAHKFMPAVKTRITNMLAETQKELLMLGKPLPALQEAAKVQLLLSAISKFTNAFAAAVEGRGACSASRTRPASHLVGGARINFVFTSVFAKSIASLDPLEGLCDAVILSAIHNASGTRSALFVPEEAFEQLVRVQIRRLQAPGHACVDAVFAELSRITNDCDTVPELRRFGTLRTTILRVVHELLRRLVAPTHAMVVNLVRMELSHISTSHPDFIGGATAVAELVQAMNGGGEVEDPAARSGAAARSNLPQDLVAALQPGTGSAVAQQWTHGATGAGGGAGATAGSVTVHHGGCNKCEHPLTPRLPPVADSIDVQTPCTVRERMGCEVIKKLLVSYFNEVVKKNFADIVPKAIMCFLVNATKDTIRDELTRTLYRADAPLDSLLAEGASTTARRKACLENDALLRRALAIVHEVREFAFSNDEA